MNPFLFSKQGRDQQKKKKFFESQKKDETKEQQLRDAQKHTHVLKAGPNEAIKNVDGEFVYRETFSTIEKIQSGKKLKPSQIILPQNALQKCYNETSSPMLCFHLISFTGVKSVYCGAAEFTASDKTIILPEQFFETLELSEMKHQKSSNKVIVTLVQLRHGDYLRLQIDSASIEPLIDLHAYLETALCDYTVIYRNQVLWLQVENREALGQARVLEFKPDDTAIVLVAGSVSLDLDFWRDDNDSADASNEVSSSLYNKSGNLLLRFSYPEQNYLSSQESSREYSCVLPPVLWSSNEQFLVVEVVPVLPASNDFPLDLFLSFPPYKEATLQRHHFLNLATVNENKRTILVSKQNYLDQVLQLSPFEILENSPLSCCVGISLVQNSVREKQASFQNEFFQEQVYKFQLSVHFKLNITKPNEKKNLLDVTPNETTNNIFTDFPNRTEDDVKNCHYCGKNVLKQSIELHEAYCSRFNTTSFKCNIRETLTEQHVHCSVCSVRLNESLLQQHMEYAHETITCSCQVSVERRHFENHKQHECPNRIKRCRFCRLFVIVGESSQNNLSDIDTYFSLFSHEVVCGTRTTSCSECNKLVLFKELDLHSEILHSSFRPLNEQRCPLCQCTNLVNEEEWNQHLKQHSKIILQTVPCINQNCNQFFYSFSEPKIDEYLKFCIRCQHVLKLTENSTISEIKQALANQYYLQLTGQCPKAFEECSTPAVFCLHSREKKDNLEKDDINLLLEKSVSLANEAPENCYVCVP